jgi:hypothetical protein
MMPMVVLPTTARVVAANRETTIRPGHRCVLGSCFTEIPRRGRTTKPSSNTHLDTRYRSRRLTPTARHPNPTLRTPNYRQLVAWLWATR